MQEYTTQEILKGISENNHIVVQHIYDRYFKEIIKFIEKFGGSYDDATDIFQDGIIVIYEQMKRGDGEKIKNFKAYFYSICKFKWLNTVRNGKYGEFSDVEMEEILPSFEYNVLSEKISDIVEKERRVKVYFNSFMKLDSMCQKMIRFVAYGWSVEDIASEMNLSVIYTYRKRQNCLKKLTEIVDKQLNKNQYY